MLIRFFILSACMISTVAFAQVNYPHPICHESLHSIGAITECMDIPPRSNGDTSYSGSITYQNEIINEVTCVAYNGTQSSFKKRSIQTHEFDYGYAEAARAHNINACEASRTLTIQLKEGRG